MGGFGSMGPVARQGCGELKTSIAAASLWQGLMDLKG